MGRKTRTRGTNAPLRPLDTDSSAIPVNNNDGASTTSGRRAASPSVWKYIDIEPLLVLHLIAAMISYIGNQNILVIKACIVDLGMDEQTCLAIGKKSAAQEQSIQKLLSSLVMWRSLIGNFLPMILVAQIGAWSDKYGRKIPMIMVMCTFVAEELFMTFAAYYRDGISAWNTGLIESAISSLAGNNACFGMAVFSYISDVTPKDKLTARTSISGSCYFLGILAGLTISGYLTEGPLPLLYATACSLEFIVLIGIIIVVKSKARAPTSTWTKIKDLFSPRYMVESMTSVFKERPLNRRKMLLLLLACHVITLAPMSGDSSVEFLAVRYRYNWDATAYSAFSMYKTVVGFVANFVSLAVLSEFLQLSDPLIGVISCMSLAAASVLSAFATTPTLAYAAPLASVLSGSVMAVSRGIIFRIVAEDETGKINSFIGSLESLTPLVVVPIYTTLYATVFETFAGCYNILSACIMIIPILVYLWIYNNMSSDMT